MQNFDPLAIGQNPIIKVINDLVTGRVDATAIGFDCLLFEPDLKGVFNNQMRFVKELFDESQTAIETTLLKPVNPYTAVLFNNWYSSIDVEQIKREIEKIVSLRPTSDVPQFIQIHCELNKVTQPQDTAFELQVRIDLVCKNGLMQPVYVYPCTQCTFILTEYKGKI